MKNEIEVVLSHNDGWWTATCEGMEGAGAGPSREEAMKNLMLVVYSQVSGRALRALHDPSRVRDVLAAARGGPARSPWPFDRIERVGVPLASPTPA